MFTEKRPRLIVYRGNARRVWHLIATFTKPIDNFDARKRQRYSFDTVPAATVRCPFKAIPHSFSDFPPQRHVSRIGILDY
jgi:hypothetical protein